MHFGWWWIGGAFWVSCVYCLIKVCFLQVANLRHKEFLIKNLIAQKHALVNALVAVEWVESNEGDFWCPACYRFTEAGHTPLCTTAIGLGLNE